jgi:hypothetical protein
VSHGRDCKATLTFAQRRLCRDLYASGMRPNAPSQWPLKRIRRLLRRDRSTVAPADFQAFDFLLPAWSNPPPAPFFWPSYQHVTHYRSPPSKAEPKPSSVVSITLLHRSTDRHSTRFSRGVASATALSPKPDSMDDVPLEPRELRIAWQDLQRASPPSLGLPYLLEVAHEQKSPPSDWAPHIASLHSLCVSARDAALWLRCMLPSPQTRLSQHEVQNVLSTFFHSSHLENMEWQIDCSQVLQTAFSHHALDDVLKYVVLPHWSACEQLLVEAPASPEVASAVRLSHAAMASKLDGAMAAATVPIFLDKIVAAYSNASLPLLFFRVLLADAAGTRGSVLDQVRRLALAAEVFWSSKECRNQEGPAAQFGKLLWRRRLFDQAWAVRWWLLEQQASPITANICDRIHKAAFKAKDRKVESVARFHDTKLLKSWRRAHHAHVPVFAQALGLSMEHFGAARLQCFEKLIADGRYSVASRLLVDTYPANRNLYMFRMALYAQARLANPAGFTPLWRELKATFPLDAESCNALLLLFAQCRDEKAALAAFNEFYSDGIQISVQMLTTLVSVLVETKTWSVVEATFQLADKLAAERQPELVPEKDVFRLDAGLYNARLKALVYAGSPLGKVYEAVDAMKASGLQPDQYTVALILEALGRDGRVSEAHKLFEKLEQPTQQHFGIMSKGAYARGSPDVALGYMARMVDADMQPNAVIYAQAIVAELARGSYRVASTLAEGYLASRADGSKDQTARDRALQASKDVNDILGPFLSSKLQQDRRTRARKTSKALTAITTKVGSTHHINKLAALEAAATQNEVPPMLAAWQDFLEYFRSLQTLGREEKQPTPLSQQVNAGLSALLVGLGRRGRFAMVADVWSALQDEGFHFDNGSWNTLVVVLLHGNLWREPLWIAEHILTAPLAYRNLRMRQVPELLFKVKNQIRKRAMAYSPTSSNKPFRFMGHSRTSLEKKTLELFRQRLDALSWSQPVDAFEQQYPRMAEQLKYRQRALKSPRAYAGLARLQY